MFVAAGGAGVKVLVLVGEGPGVNVLVMVGVRLGVKVGVFVGVGVLEGVAVALLIEMLEMTVRALSALMGRFTNGTNLGTIALKLALITTLMRCALPARVLLVRLVSVAEPKKQYSVAAVPGPLS